MTIHTISDSQKLEEKCTQWQTLDYITIDTEFLRTSTYRSQLCLIQVGHKGEGWLIDPLANIDLTPLMAVLKNTAILKIFHDSRQDIEIFYHDAGFCPAPVFDTQIAAQACGFGNSASYEVLVRELLSLAIDKSARVTDWSKRPLSDKQKLYALSDVTHLCQVYEKLSERLKKLKRDDWVKGEFAELSRPALYENPPDKAWRNLKFSTNNPQQQRMLEGVAAWREEQAQKLNRPRGWILRDDALRELMVAASNGVPLREISCLPPKMVQSKGGEALEKAIAKVHQELKSSPPGKAKQRQGKNSKNDNKLSMLKLLLKIQCEHHQVAAKLIATSRDLENFVGAPDEPWDIKEGFRYEIFGKHAEALMEGEISLTMINGKSQIVKTSPTLAPKKS